MNLMKKMYRYIAQKIRRHFFAVMTLLEAKSDFNYYFLGLELHVQPSTRLDLLLKYLLKGENSVHDFHTFYKIIDKVADNDSMSFDELELICASEGLIFYANLSDEAQNYILLKAFNRGRSLAKCRRDKNHFLNADFASLYPQMLKSMQSIQQQIFNISSVSFPTIEVDTCGKIEEKTIKIKWPTFKADRDIS